jgi:hypothetical protein
MSALPITRPENISNLLNMDQEYAAPPIVASRVLQRDWQGARERSLKDPEGFWAQYAEEFEWSHPWNKVLEWDGIHHKWFTGAKTNITVNALDRHAHSELRNRAAFIWLGEDGSERIVTYGQLHRQVCRFANGLKSLGVVKGDRVIIYMPLTIEGAIAMLPAHALVRSIPLSTPDSATPPCAIASPTRKPKSSSPEMSATAVAKPLPSKPSSTRLSTPLTSWKK